MNRPVESNFAPINGLDLYYEIHGSGDPVILLHGGISASEMFGENLTLLAKTRKVVAIHLQGHGNTKDIDRRLRYEFLADDVAGITAPTMLVFADADCVRLEHMVDVYKRLGGGLRDAGLDGSLRTPNRLAIIPGATHYNILSTTTVAQFAQDFLDA